MLESAHSTPTGDDVPRRAKERVKAWWTAEVAVAIKRRREASLLHLRLSKHTDHEATAGAWAEFLARKREAAALVQSRIRDLNQRFLADLQRAERQAPQRFWRHIQSGSRTAPQSRLRASGDEQTLEGVACVPLLEEWLRAFQRCEDTAISPSEPGGQVAQRTGRTAAVHDDSILPADVRQAPTDREFKQATRRVDAETALGVDGIPMSLIKALGPKARMRVGDLLSRVLVEAEIPRDWKRSRVRPLYKGTGDRRDLNNCRPIALTPVLYRMTMQVVKSRLQRWAERKGVLGELKAGFRVGRRIEDNLFVLTQCIEISPADWEPALCGVPGYFHGIRSGKSGDAVGAAPGTSAPGTADIPTQVEWGGETTAPVDITRGLRTGMSSLPTSFHVLCGRGDAPVGVFGEWLPAGTLGRGAAGIPSNPSPGTQRTWALQGDTVHMTRAAKYLGVHLSTGPDYLATHERHIKTKAARNKGFLGRHALWAFNRYEVLCALWKMVAVPGLTYANATLCLSAGTREFLERIRQRDAGRMALGVHKNTPVEGIQRDLGWSSFTAREAVAKLSYEGRFLRSPDTNLAHQTLIHTIYSGISTRWTRRTGNLRRRYEVPPESIASAAAQPVSTTAARIWAQVTKVETREWLEGAKAKPSLDLYSATKTTMGREKFFDNSLGSGLLAEARLGVLRTRVWRAKFTAGLDTTCTTGGAAEEIPSHIVLECPAVTPAPESQTLSAALGFEEAGVRGGGGGGLRVRQCETTPSGLVATCGVATERRLEQGWQHGAVRSVLRH
ncbi:hypothetical protein HPB48_024432 [Haemaphysalis longicornis]|uniref:Reverse transcriptase domain-containing protein n=1 Tax=Haemaphysalis longicornis TaxID=44386 RepID=A0A9J6H8N9_HAELO|nr:hypothetical protein HPB48_024432 [Haemaphysalis longicornis]